MGVRIWKLTVPEKVVKRNGQQMTLWHPIAEMKQSDKGHLRFHLPPGISLSPGVDYFVFPPRADLGVPMNENEEEIP